MSMNTNFCLIESLNIEDYARLEFYQHNSGLVVVLMKENLKTGPPYRNFSVTFITEPYNDMGIPHALEHMLFFASENFPYNGIITKIANRFLVPVVNAFTHYDYTSYVLECIGDDGLYTLMEIFLDHVIMPKFSQENFLTEVVHMDENGEYHGVVYSEITASEKNIHGVIDSLVPFYTYCDLNMSSVSNINLGSSSSLNHNNYDKNDPFGLYNKIISEHNGGSPYIFPCSGITRSLMNLKLEDIKKYHEKYYKWNNAFVFISGNNIDNSQIFSIIQKCIDRTYKCMELDTLNTEKNIYVEHTSQIEPSEKHHLNKIPKISLANRPQYFMEIPKRESPIEVTIPYSSEDEEMGYIFMTWLIGKYENLEETAAVSCLLHYLCIGNESLFIKKLVDKLGICSDIDIENISNRYRYHYISLESVNLDYFDLAISTAKEILIESQKEENFDLDRIRCKTEGLYYEYLSSLENKGPSIINEQLIGFVAYSMKPELLNSICNFHFIYKGLLEKDSKYWLMLLRKFFNPDSFNCIKFVPSLKATEFTENQYREKKLQNINLLKSEGLLKNKKQIQDAIEYNSKQMPPMHIIESFELSKFTEVSLNKACIYTNIGNNTSCRNNLKYLDENSKDSGSSKKEISTLNILNNPSDNLVNFKVLDEDFYCTYCLLDSPTSKFAHLQIKFNIPDYFTPYQRVLTTLIVELFFQTSVNIVEPCDKVNTSYTNHIYLPKIPEYGSYVEFDKFDQLLSTFCIHHNASIGNNSLMEFTTITNQIEINWTTSIEYICESCILILSGICGMDITSSRISTISRRLKSTIGDMKLDEVTIATSVSNALCYSSNSSLNLSSIPCTEKIVKYILSSPEKYLADIISTYELLIDSFFSSNVRNKFLFFVIAPKHCTPNNLPRYLIPKGSIPFHGNKSNQISIPIKEDCEVKKKLVAVSSLKYSNLNLSLPWNLIPTLMPLQTSQNLGKNNIDMPLKKYGNIIFLKLPSVSSSCVIQTANIYSLDGTFLPNETHFYNPNIPALCILVDYFWHDDGPLFKLIRGSGIAYSGSFSICLVTGKLFNCICESTSLARCLVTTWDLLEDMIESCDKYIDLDTAKRYAALNFISDHKSFSKWGKDISSNLNYGIPPSYDEYMISQFSKVTMDDINRVAKRYLPLLLPRNILNSMQCSTVSMCGDQNSANEVKKMFDSDYPHIKVNFLTYSQFSNALTSTKTFLNIIDDNK
ncbi:peptidase M16 inactive domain-containing protein [Cryptosporidium muris RN66]|uniref:Peptidase M16 inactive domain-containing protein n=1 Tax=Cryptosporidium muris (strain RN66) TaxID=441375 RepID=B6ABB4_CRYMR|nr:peptidase M16 inactive domain-containing protein [Cryptosporidium muris RN66]EEA05666.1 peptidase M16 inactive domain-containing protein [Cryptosporidium muris RN66]|eukprot:XP_002140015.1 peptidase M16 inactive domain-containing protein [Cryptosporidium muris RN66]